MKDIEVCIPIITTLLGVAYPILLQVISLLESKYNASSILSIFENEYEYKSFKWLLYASLLSTIFYILGGYTLILKYHPRFQECINSMLLVVVACAVICFFLLINKVLLYLSTRKLVDYLISKKNSEGIYNSEILESITDIYCWAIKNEEEKIAETLNDHVYKLFSDFRKSKPNNPEGYPDAYYSLYYKVSRNIALSNSKILTQTETLATGGIFLLGEFVSNAIAIKTYRYLWFNLMFCVKNDKGDSIMTYWKNAFQFFQYSLPEIVSEYSPDYSQIMNSNDIIKRKQERKKYLEFHYAFGGLLYYKSKFNCIKRIFDFTNQQPPEYVLFPKSMTSLFEWYMHFSDNLYNRELAFMDFVYPFPDTEGVKADGTIRGSICSYISLLFLRQYTLIEYTYQSFTDMPVLPKEIIKCRIWLENIDAFINDVNFILKKISILRELGFEYYDYFSDGWCEKNNKIKPIDLLKTTKFQLEEKIIISQKEQSLSVSKIEKFRNNSKVIVDNFIQNIEKASISKEPENNYNFLQMRGQSYLFDRFAFCDDADISYGDVESVLAESLTISLKRKYSAFFISNRTTIYTLETKDVFKAIDKLNVSSEYVIIMFGVYLDFYKDILKIKDLKEDKYGEIDILKFDTCIPSVYNSLFIIKKQDLPSLRFYDIPETDKVKYKLTTQIDENHHVYADIIDYKENPELLQRIKNENRDPNKDLSKCVLAKIDLFAELRMGKDVEMIHMLIDSGYEQRGLVSYIHDITPLE